MASRDASALTKLSGDADPYTRDGRGRFARSASGVWRRNEPRKTPARDPALLTTFHAQDRQGRAVRLNLDPDAAADDQHIPGSAFRAATKAFNRRANDLATPTATSRRIAAAMKDEAVAAIVDGSIPWGARKIGNADHASLLESARDSLMMKGETYGLRNPVDLAAAAEFDEWLAARDIPPAPPRTPETHRAAQAAQVAIIEAINAGSFDRGSYTGRSRQRHIPASWVEVGAEPGENAIAAGRGNSGTGRKLQLEDRPVVEEIDEWLRAGMRPMPPGAPPLHRDLPEDDLEKIARSLQSVMHMPRDIRARLPPELRNKGATNPRSMI